MAAWLPIIAGASAVANWISGNKADKRQREAMEQQRRFAEPQLQLGQSAFPYYEQALQAFARNAGLAGYGGQQSQAPQGLGTITGPGGRTAPAFGSRRTLADVNPAYQFNAAPAPPMGSDWGSQADQLRLQQAEEDINRYADRNANMMRFQASRSGLNQGALGAMMARNQQAAQQDYSRFRRGLAIDAGREQERRLGLLMNAAGPAFGQGAMGANIYGQQAGVYGQQAQQGYGALTNVAQNLAYQDALRRYSGQYQAPPIGGQTPTLTPPPINPYDPYLNPNIRF